MTFAQAASSALRKYATFSGRASRSEFWWFVLFYTVAIWGVVLVAGLLGYFLFLIVFGSPHGVPAVARALAHLAALFMAMPFLAVCVRRFHDMDRTGWWFLICFTGIGVAVMYMWFMFKGTSGPNRFGADPLQA
ncbi:DUF805 domain-containing protein [Ancylobacter sp. IITR112]|uniref:DUF805 domain-containing protein n=1 Tax=Ancylobacter sp. IITR112 TaxID=3138073 RepID=UPI00352BB8B2